MDKTIPAPAAILLDFIGQTEAPKGYNTVFGNNQSKLSQPLTTMTVDEVIAAGPTFTRSFGSSAAGRYQFMRATLQDLKRELRLRGIQVLDANLQDRLGYHLLRRRGYDDFVAGRLSPTAFGKALAQEWASFPVLANVQGAHRPLVRGQSYYAGDGLNKALVKPEAIEKLLAQALSAATSPAPPPPAPSHPDICPTCGQPWPHAA